MKLGHSRSAWALALATAAGLLQTPNARADFEDVSQRRAGIAETFWLSRSSAVRAAVRAWDRGAVATAVRRSKRALRGKLAPSDRQTALHLACVGETQLGRPDSALRFCNEAVALSDARDPRHLNNRANALLQAGHVVEAIADYEHAIALVKQDTWRGRRGGSSEDEPRSRISETLETNLNLAHRRRAAELESAATAEPGKPRSEMWLAEGDESHR